MEFLNRLVYDFLGKLYLVHDYRFYGVAFYLMKKFAKKGPVPPEDNHSDEDDDLIDFDAKGANA